jgi:aminoglycoside phosphotransferase (APT) family kinase protein
MHDGEVDVDVGRVRRLLVTQFPHWAALPPDVVHPTGTVNTIDRLGDEMCVRLPRVQRWAGDLERERPCRSTRNS